MILMKKITPEIIELDKSSLRTWEILFFKFYNILCGITLFVLNNFIRAFNDSFGEYKLKKYYNQSIKNELFTKNKNFIFDQLTYRRYYGLLNKQLCFFIQSPKIIYTQSVILLIQEVDEHVEEKSLARIIKSMNKAEKDLRTQSSDSYFINSRGFVIKSLLNSHRASIHKIIIKKSCNESILSMDNQFFIKNSHETIHFFSVKEYYFVINRLINPTEFHHYLCFRTWLCERKLHALHSVSEASLLGQYLMDDKDALPNNQYENDAKEFDSEQGKWEIILSSLYNTIGIIKTFEMDYYFILACIAKLRLDELILLRDTFINHFDSVINTKHNSPSEINVLLPFGFVFIENFHKDREKVSDHYNIALHAYCHERQLRNCIAIVLSPTKNKDNALDCHIEWRVFSNKININE